MKTLLTCTVNGEEYSVLADTRDTLLDLLRDRLGLTGTKEGCGNGNCGTCTVLMDGAPINACLVLAVEAPGRELFTAIREALGELPIIAEDLGVITADVEQLRDDFGFPGMRILQFAFSSDTMNVDLPPARGYASTVRLMGDATSSGVAAIRISMPLGGRARRI